MAPKYNPANWTFSQKCAAAVAVSSVIMCIPIAYPIILGAMNAPMVLKDVSAKSEEHTKAIASIKEKTDMIPQIQSQLNAMEIELHLLCDAKGLTVSSNDTIAPAPANN